MTYEQMRESIIDEFDGLWDGNANDPNNLFTIECAIYWFANDYHSGQSSDLYKILCLSMYQPGPIESGPEDNSLDRMIYDFLVTTYYHGKGN